MGGPIPIPVEKKLGSFRKLTDKRTVLPADHTVFPACNHPQHYEGEQRQQAIQDQLAV